MATLYRQWRRVGISLGVRHGVLKSQVINLKPYFHRRTGLQKPSVTFCISRDFSIDCLSINKVWFVRNVSGGVTNPVALPVKVKRKKVNGSWLDENRSERCEPGGVTVAVGRTNRREATCNSFVTFEPQILVYCVEKISSFNKLKHCKNEKKAAIAGKFGRSLVESSQSCLTQQNP